MEPIVSILVPCYNEEKHLKIFFDKILNQTYNKIELVIINDGSTDNSEKIIKEHEKRIKKRGYFLKYRKKENGGLGSAIQLGLRIMTGDLFCWCDCDNFYENTYVEKCVNVFNSRPKCNIVRCDGLLFYEDDLKKPYHQFTKYNTDKFKKRLFLNAILEKNFHFGCAMLRTKAFDKVCPNREIYESRVGQNWQLLLPMFYYYDSYFIDENLFNYINCKGSISNDNSCSEEKLLNLYKEHEKILVETLNKMDIRDKKFYIGKVKEKYIKYRIEVAKSYNDEELLKQETFNLKKFSKREYFVLFPKYRKV